jgi:hypothetical protein
MGTSPRPPQRARGGNAGSLLLVVFVVTGFGLGAGAYLGGFWSPFAGVEDEPDGVFVEAAVVADAGSTGTRFHLYRLEPDVTHIVKVSPSSIYHNCSTPTLRAVVLISPPSEDCDGSAHGAGNASHAVQ